MAISIAFIRLHGDGGPPQNPLNWNPVPWQIWVAYARSGAARRSGRAATLRAVRCRKPPAAPSWSGSLGIGSFLRAKQDNWPHLYVVAAYARNAIVFGTRGLLGDRVHATPNAGATRILTPGAFMVEDVSVSPDLNRSSTRRIPARRQATTIGATCFGLIFKTDVIVQLTKGESSEWQPVTLAEDGLSSENGVAFDSATAQQPPVITVQEPRHTTGYRTHASAFDASWTTFRRIFPRRSS